MSFTSAHAAGSRPSGKSCRWMRELSLREEGVRRVARLELTLPGPRQDDVIDLQARLALGQVEQGPSGADLNVVGVRAHR